MAEKKEGTRVYGTPGYIVVEIDGQSTQYSMTEILLAANIPSLTYVQVGAIKTLANLIVVLIRTLIDRDILNESFMEDNDYDLAAIVKTIEDMGGDYGEPDLTVG